MASGPTAAEGTESRAAPRTVRCPRCNTPIAGDFKFCPACALRLRPSVAEPHPEEARASWKTGLLVACAVAGVLGCAALGGILLLHPSSFSGSGLPVLPAPELTSLVEPAFTVSSIPDNLQELPPGNAYNLPLDAIPGIEEKERADIRKDFGEYVVLSAWIGYPMRVLRYEVTRGQYAEFISDLEEHRERIPKIWLSSDRVSSARDVDLYDHIPAAWVTPESETSPLAWSVPIRDRNLPVTQVSYFDALGFCEWASAKTGLELRIPFAMEWVRAARGGSLDMVDVFPWGSAQLVYACNNLGSFGRPQYVHYSYAEPIPGRGTTREGLYAMAGNVREMALDHDFEIRPQLQGQGPPTVTWKQRADVPTIWAYGGSFHSGIDDCTVESKTLWSKYERRQDDLGFRVFVRDPH